MKDLHCGSCGGDRRGFGWAQINTHALRDLMVLVLQINDALPLHKVKELVLVAGVSLECLAGGNPAQHTQDVFSACERSVKDFCELSLRRLRFRQCVRIDKDCAWHATS